MLIYKVDRAGRFFPPQGGGRKAFCLLSPVPQRSSERPNRGARRGDERQQRRVRVGAHCQGEVGPAARLRTPKVENPDPGNHDLVFKRARSFFIPDFKNLANAGFYIFQLRQGVLTKK